MARAPTAEVPTMDDFLALKAQVDDHEVRITALENPGNGGTVPQPSPDGTTVADTHGRIVDAAGRTFKLVESNVRGVGYRIDMDGTVSGAGVVRLYAKGGLCYQENNEGYWWYMGESDWIEAQNPTGEGGNGGGTNPGNYTFSDEFNSITLWNRDQPDGSLPWRPTRWYSPDEWDGWNCNNGRMLNPYKQPAAWELYGVDADGNLFLGMDRADARFGDVNGRGYVTSQINQLSFKQKGGYWEARLKAPLISGTNTAFWLMNDQSWPPEVDIVEMVQFTNGTHVMAQNLWHTDQTTEPYYDYNAAPDAWHTYGFWWDEANGRMHYFFDGAHTHETAVPSGYDHPMFVILSMQQGGDWSGPVPDGAQMGRALFDYVRISADLPGALLAAPQAARSGPPPEAEPMGLGRNVKFERGQRPRRR